VITEAGNDPKVVGLVYVAAFAPDNGESVGSLSKGFPPRARRELRPDSEGYLSISPRICRGFCAGPARERSEGALGDPGPTNAAAFGATITNAAWKTKPSWFVVAAEDRAIRRRWKRRRPSE